MVLSINTQLKTILSCFYPHARSLFPNGCLLIYAI